jgi:hypothetical protein
MCAPILWRLWLSRSSVRQRLCSRGRGTARGGQGTAFAPSPEGDAQQDGLTSHTVDHSNNALKLLFGSEVSVYLSHRGVLTR